MFEDSMVFIGPGSRCTKYKMQYHSFYGDIDHDIQFAVAIPNVVKTIGYKDTITQMVLSLNGRCYWSLKRVVAGGMELQLIPLNQYQKHNIQEIIRQFWRRILWRRSPWTDGKSTSWVLATMRRIVMAGGAYVNPFTFASCWWYSFHPFLVCIVLWHHNNAREGMAKQCSCCFLRMWSKVVNNTFSLKFTRWLHNSSSTYIVIGGFEYDYVEWCG